MSRKSKTNRPNQLAGDQQLITGFTKHQATLSSLIVNGSSLTTAAILGILQARIASALAVAPAKATYQAVVEADREEQARSRAIVSGIRQALMMVFAGQIEVLADFGLKPRKQAAPRTPEQKAAAVAKAKATRAARHTMGPKQKAKITGASAPAAEPAVAAPAAGKAQQ